MMDFLEKRGWEAALLAFRKPSQQLWRTPFLAAQLMT
jgi:hypothetical protein